MPPHGRGDDSMVLFIFACLLYPPAINEAEFYAGFVGVLLILLIYSVDVMIRSPASRSFAAHSPGFAIVLAADVFYGCRRNERRRAG